MDEKIKDTDNVCILYLSEEYKKDVFCNFVYGFEPLK